MANTNESPMEPALPNGAGAAAILAAGIGCAALGVLTLLAETFSGIKSFLNFYNPVGPLSGVTTLAIVVWLVSWFVLRQNWNDRDVPMTRITYVAFALLAIGFFLTFPPGFELLKGE